MRSKHLLYRFPRCQLLKNELYGNAGPSNDRFAHHDRWIGLDQFFSHCFYLHMNTATPNTCLDNTNAFSPCRYLASFTTHSLKAKDFCLMTFSFILTHFPFSINFARPSAVRRYFCSRLWGLLGIV